MPGKKPHAAAHPIGKVSLTTVRPTTVEDGLMTTLSLSRNLQLLLRATIWKVRVQEEHVEALADKLEHELDEHGHHASERQLADDPRAADHASHTRAHDSTSSDAHCQLHVLETPPK